MMSDDDEEDEPGADGDEEDEPGAGGLRIERTPRDQMCDALRKEAEGLCEAVDLLTDGAHELELAEDHELYEELANAREVMGHIAWLLGTNAVREGRSLR
jgi:hypothetical protein